MGKVPDCSQQSVGRSGPSLSGQVVCLFGAFIFYIYMKTLGSLGCVVLFCLCFL